MAASVRQPSLFDTGPRVLAQDAQGGIVYTPALIDGATAQAWFERLRDGVAWQSYSRPMYDRIVEVPRLVASYRLSSPELPEVLARAAAVVRAHTGVPFNAVGLNHYRDGQDSVAPHNDKLRILVPPHPIALLSVGSTRRMIIRAKQPPRRAMPIDLEPGSLLVMSYDSQKHYDHGVPKTREEVGPRISLAFRVRPDAEPMP
ncbi:alpha-ketoglutarate-dependent dioxygenase AlkB [Agrilutibacter solisilvae]|uniref:Alpha-ketoglutarate-dependent dioxygenase AlkB n=1 Tax=Agrilutibacter solisilvae TaxID=2763317 RepID=A0A974Y066_9GAMM|nr:alpha-ketoglutarate-dependent dioxygenase AlkB [Lysobacter solisilvae]QSX78153.1 alpha-ketoglutarate-dependent dioxygenase AlkB [Lysobacter solisilvae]